MGLIMAQNHAEAYLTAILVTILRPNDKWVLSLARIALKWVEDTGTVA